MQSLLSEYLFIYYLGENYFIVVLVVEHRTDFP